MKKINKYKIKFEEFKSKRVKKLKIILISLSVLWLILLLNQPDKLINTFHLFSFIYAIFFPITSFVCQVAMYEYCKGNVYWEKYLWIALLGYFTLGIVVLVQWFYLTSDKARFTRFLQYNNFK